ncbi:MAG: hypothetical protein WC693_05760 [Patescibacteria group bacterium]|jgi:hypothetical protein
MEDTSKQVLAKIEKEKITPKPKWQFRLEQIGIWFLAIISVLIGSNAFAVIIFAMVNNDWEVLELLERNPVSHTLATIPYLWLVVLALFVLLTYYNTRHTNKGYRYNTYGIVIGSILASILVGTILYLVGFAPGVDRLIRGVPGVNMLMHNREEIWNHPEDGFVAGEITNMLGGAGAFELVDLDNKEWIIRTDNVVTHPKVVIRVGESLRIIGKIDESNIFDAYQIMPWQFNAPANIRIFQMPKGHMFNREIE